MRRAGEVIKAVRDAVPVEQAELRDRLARLADDSWFQAPESPTPWRQLRDVLESTIGEPSQPWHFAVIDIVQGKAVSR